MDKKIAGELHGFRLDESKYIEEINGTYYRFTYLKTDTPLVYLDRPDKNKTFAIAFRTPPKDDTGVFHILEHSVLCGSEKYPIKDPFTELLKGSVSTYLNAFTYPDRTVYPVSSKNGKAFLDLISVYMDSVLHPLAVGNPDIFNQEGYRLELSDGTLTESGTVYNEMQGAYASFEELGSYHVGKRLYPGGTYGYESGGYPDAIRTLTYDEFVSAHKKYYHPTNAVIFLDGDIETDGVLSLIDSCLCEYEKGECYRDIPLGERVLTEPVSVPYPEVRTEDNRQAYIAYRLPYMDGRDTLALSVIADVLTEENTSHLKKKILASGACNNFFLSPVTSYKHPLMKLEFCDVRDCFDGDLLALYEKSVGEVLDEGIDPKAIKAALEITKFRAKEADYGSYPVGMMYMNSVFEAFVKGDDPAETLTYNELFKHLYEQVGTEYYSDVVKKYMMPPSETVSVTLTPDTGLEQKREAERASRLSALYASLDEKAKSRIAAEQKSRELRNATPDTEEALATLPVLKISDIDEDITETVNTDGCVQGVRTLYHPIDTHGISYCEIRFDVSDIDEEELFPLSLLSTVYNEFDIGKDTALEFSNKAKSILGNLGITADATKCGEKINLHLSFKISCLDSNLEKAAELLLRCIYEAKYENPEMLSSRIDQLDSGIDSVLVNSGSKFASLRASARYDKLSAVRERLVGFEFLKKIRGAAKDAEYQKTLPSAFNSIREKYFTKGRARIVVTGEQGEKFAELVVPRLASGDGEVGKSNFTLFPRRNEGIVVNSAVSCTAFMTNLKTEGGVQDCPGSLSVLSTIMNFELLWNEIRVKGGAYDTGMTTKHNSGTAGFYSFSDPTPERSAEIFRKAHLLIEEFLDTDTDLTKYIVGTVGASDGITTPRSEGERATLCYFSGITNDELKLRRKQLLLTDKAELARLSGVLKKAEEAGTLCVLASREKLSEMKDQLDEILEA